MKTIEPVTQAVILAAGRGTRLSPITDETPKALVPFLGRPLIEHAAAHLVSIGMTRIAVNTHHLGEQVALHVETTLLQATRMSQYKTQALRKKAGKKRKRRE